jgi:hypothetical protein
MVTCYGSDKICFRTHDVLLQVGFQTSSGCAATVIASQRMSQAWQLMVGRHPEQRGKPVGM